MKRYLLLILFLFSFLFACGSKVSGWVGSDCYECADTPSVCLCPGYGGFNNPKALNLSRPGRFGDLGSPMPPFFPPSNRLF